MTLVRFLILGVALAAAVPLPSSAAYVDASELLRMCQQGEAAKVICNFYIAGAADMGEFWAIGSGKEDEWCRPADKVTAEMLAAVVVKFLRANPELHHMAASISVAAAIKGAYCPQE